MDSLDLKVPRCWEDMTQSQLRDVFRAMARFGSMEAALRHVAAHCIMKWNGMKMVSPYGRNWIIKATGREYVMDHEQFTEVCRSMDWLAKVPDSPMRLDHIGKSTAMMELPIEEMTFEQWIACDNLFQGYIFTQEEDLLRQMAEILYRCDNIRLTPGELINVFYWWTSVKNVVSAMFQHFFRPAGAVSGDMPDADDIRHSVDSQIRALTKGDISKEPVVLSMPAARALTELNAQAREMEELNKKYPSKS